MNEAYKLSESDIRDIYEKTVDFIENKMYEVTENNFELDVTKEQIDAVIKRNIFVKLVTNNMIFLRMNKNELEPYIEYNFERVNQIIKNE